MDTCENFHNCRFTTIGTFGNFDACTILQILSSSAHASMQDVARDDVPRRRELATTLNDDDRMRAAAQREKPRALARWRREARRLADQIRRWIRLAPSMHRRRVPWE
jgi:hypothetical protein